MLFLNCFSVYFTNQVHMAQAEDASLIFIQYKTISFDLLEELDGGEIFNFQENGTEFQ